MTPNIVSTFPGRGVQLAREGTDARLRPQCVRARVVVRLRAQHRRSRVDGEQRRRWLFGHVRQPLPVGVSIFRVRIV